MYQWCSRGRTAFPQIYILVNDVPPNDIRTRGNGDAVPFHQIGLQRNVKVYGKLILRKIIEIFATKCHILKLKCIKFDFSWGSTQTPLGSLQHSPAPSWI